MQHLLRASRLFDGSGRIEVDDAAVLVEGERIVAAGPASAISPGEEVTTIDLSARTLLPGLIDAHLHLDGWRSLNRIDWVLIDDGLRALRAAADARTMLASGYTCVRDAGSMAAIALKQAIEEGELEGPRLWVSGKGIYQTGGQGDRAHLPIDWVLQRESCLLVDGPSECRRAVREVIRAGADFIKIGTSGGHLSAEPHLSLEEIQTLCDEAHRVGKRVAAHALGEEGIRNAILGGVDSIEHGAWLTPELATMMVERDIWLVPTLSTFNRRLQYARAHETLKQVTLVEQGWEGAVQCLRVALKAGVRIAAGSDWGGQPIFPVSELANELELMVELGMHPADAIIAATHNGAAIMGLEANLGTLEEGKLADIIAVRGDPLTDVRCLRQVDFVMKSGRLIHTGSK